MLSDFLVHLLFCEMAKTNNIMAPEENFDPFT